MPQRRTEIPAVVVRHRLFSLGFAAIALAAACGGRSEHRSANGEEAAGGAANAATAGAGGETTSVFSGLSERYENVLCTLYMTCGTDLFRDRADCLSALAGFGVEALVLARAEGHVLVDEDALERCLAAAEAEPCVPGRERSLVNGEFDIFQFAASCGGAIVPQQGLGDPCNISAECETRYDCEGNTCPGVCKPRYGLGEACAEEHAQCAVPYGSCHDGVCRIPVDVGQTCTDDFDCRLDLLCDADTLRCVEPASRPGAGEPCINDFNGAKPALLCGAGLFCDDGDQVGTYGVCSPLGSEGDTCNSRSCAPGLECTSIAGGPAECHGPAAEGAACAPNTGTACAAGLTCQASADDPAEYICVPRRALGQICNAPGVCDTDLFCNYGVCVRAAYPGDACDDQSAVCQHSTCVSGVCVGSGHAGDGCANPGGCGLLQCRAGVCTDATTCSSF